MDEAGKTMVEIVDSIDRVTSIVSEISSASAEQSSSVQQVGEAVMQMDQATQPNAALVEESAAAADSLRSQANQLVQAVAVFKLSQHHVFESAPVATSTRVKPANVTQRKREPEARVGRLAAKAMATPPAVGLSRPGGVKAGADEQWAAF